MKSPTSAAGATLAVVLAASLGACAVYHASPLPTAPDLAVTPQRMTVDPAKLRVQPLKTIAIDASDGLSPLEVAVLTVLNSPDLAARRRAAKVSDAQVFAAGLLPDPQISASSDKPVSGPDTQTAYSVSASLDLAGVLATINARRAAKATARQADLDLLWAEWSDAQQARQLAETVLANEARAVVLHKVVALAEDRFVRSDRALQHRDVTLQTNAADLAAKVDAETQLLTAEHDAQKALFRAAVLWAVTPPR